MVTQQQVHDALRHLHGTKFVTTEIAKRIAVTMPSQDARTAFIAAVSTAFDCADLEEVAELRDLVFQSDIEASLSRALAASRCNVSLRSFYRKRQMALRVIADHFNRIFKTDPVTEELLRLLSETPPSPERESAMDATFSQLRFEFQAHRSTGDAMAMQTVVAKVAAHLDALSPAEMIEMRLMQAETLIKTGDFSRAAELLRSSSEASTLRSHRRLLFLALLQHARLAASLGNATASMRYALAVAEACASWQPEWAQAQMLLGRASAVAGLTWSYKPDPHLEAADDLQLQAVRARHIFLKGSNAQAHKESLRVFAQARSRRLFPAASYAAATISICHGSLDAASRDSWAVTALRLFASCGSASDIAKDLFQFGTTHSGGWLTHAKEADLLDVYCCLRTLSHSSTISDFHPFIAALVRTVVRETAGRQSTDASLDDLVELAWDAARGTGGVACIANELESLAQLGEFLKVLWPATDQPAYAARFKSTAGIVVRSITRELSHRQIRALSHVS